MRHILTCWICVSPGRVGSGGMLDIAVCNASIYDVLGWVQ